MYGKKILFYGGQILVILVLLWLMLDLWFVLQPLFWGICLAYFIYPLVQYFTSKKIPLSFSILIVYLFIGILLVFTLLWAIPLLLQEMDSFLQILPDYIIGGKQLWHQVTEKFPFMLLPESVQNILENFHADLEENLMTGVGNMMERLLAVLGNLFSLALAPVFAYYLLKDKENIGKKIQSYIPPKTRQKLLPLCHEINILLRQFLQGYLTVSVFVGILSILGYSFIGMPYAFALGILAGILDLIPYFGPFLAAIPVALLALIEGKKMFFSVLIVCFAVQQIESLVSPKIIGERIGMHPIFIILSVLIGGYWFGILGMVFAVPAFAILGKVISILYGEKVAYEKYLPTELENE